MQLRAHYFFLQRNQYRIVIYHSTETQNPVKVSVTCTLLYILYITTVYSNYINIVYIQNVYTIFI